MPLETSENEGRNIQEQALHPLLTVDYIGRLIATRDILKKRSDLDGPIHHGPRYYTETKKSDRIAITSIYYDHDTDFDNIHRKVIMLFAEDEGQRIIGDRKIELTPHDSFLRAEGSISTGLRGQGIAMPIELSTKDFLQRMATAERIPIIWRVYNSNFAPLKIARAEYLANPGSEALAMRVWELEQQQERWRSLYGPQGLLGFKMASLGSPQDIIDDTYIGELVILPDPLKTGIGFGTALTLKRDQNNVSVVTENTEEQKKMAASPADEKIALEQLLNKIDQSFTL